MDPIAHLRSHPERSALFLDIDGTLAPIVDQPEDARVPDETKAELRRLVDRYALVACVTGRPEEFAQSFVDVEGVAVIGEHGLGLDPSSDEWAERVHRFADGVDWDVERKRYAVSFHYRTHPDPLEAEGRLRAVATAATVEGLKPRWGRMVLEVLPPVDADKGLAVRTLLARRPDVRAALYAGDDTTDVDGFRGLTEAELELALRVAVVTDETPDVLREAADITVQGTDGLLDLLRLL